MESMAPMVQFARYVNGQIQLFRDHVDRLEFIAVSHVWGNTEWQQVRGVPYEILVSKKKAAFIEEDLPAIVEDKPFWMDILTVNQRDRAEVIATTQSIPAIFREAAWTLAVREGDGLYQCCAAAIQGFREWEDMTDRMQDHAWQHSHQVNTESYLQRLWTLQECLMSHTIRFVTIGSDVLSDDTISHWDVYHPQVRSSRILDSLYVLAHGFEADRDGVKSLTSMYNFFRAYMTNGTVSRPKPDAPSKEDNIYTKEVLAMNRASNRRSTKARDYIFATMPQFPWYHLPNDAKSLDFNAIFVDFYEQATKAGHGFACRFTRSMTDRTCTDPVDAWKPSQQQPEPASLGDFLKLLGQRWSEAGDVDCCFFTTIVNVTAEPGELNFNNTLDAVKATMGFSPRIWSESHRGGELSEYGSQFDTDHEITNLREAIESWTGPSDEPAMGDQEASSEVARLQEELERLQRVRLEDDWIRRQARQILDFFWGSVNPIEMNKPMQSDWHYHKQGVRKSWSLRLQHFFLLLAAMVSCQVPLSAVTWIDEHFVPVHLEFYSNSGSFRILGLLAKHAYTESMENGQGMMCVGRHFTGPASGMDLVLVCLGSKLPIGLIPDFLHAVRTEEEYMDRIKLLFYGLSPTVGPRGAVVRRVPLDAITFVGNSRNRAG